MTPEEYAASQFAITAGLVAYVSRVASFFRVPIVGARDWLDFLRMLFPEVQKRYDQSAELGRRFYDSQRKKHHPDLAQNERLLSELKFEWFVQNMEPTRKGMSQADSPQVAVTKVALSAVREVEMAGRRQVIGAVKNDPILVEKLESQEPIASFEDVVALRGKTSLVEPFDENESRPVIGWARIATGRETCAWCLMLISRGVDVNHKGNFAYAEASTAGLDLTDETALQLWEQSGRDPAKFKELLFDDDDPDETVMDKWHVGCDCIAVPVFDLNNWPGKEQASRAMALWIDAGKEADKLIESGESRTKNVGRETLNALRRRLERGEISMSNYAVAA